MGGRPDHEVYEAAQGEDRIPVTFDLDFCDIRAYPPASHVGIWILRPRTQSIANASALLQRALSVLESEPVQGRIWIIEPERVRIRE